jgi:hypothetical protein
MRSRSKSKKAERDVRSMSPASKSILKKSKETQDEERKVKSSGAKFNLIQPNEAYPVGKLPEIKPPLNSNVEGPDGNAVERIDQLGTGTHAVIID